MCLSRSLHCLQMLCFPGFRTHANTQNLPHAHAYFSWQTPNCQIVPALPSYSPPPPRPGREIKKTWGKFFLLTFGVFLLRVGASLFTMGKRQFSHENPERLGPYRIGNTATLKIAPKTSKIQKNMIFGTFGVFFPYFACGGVFLFCKGPSFWQHENCNGPGRTKMPRVVSHYA